MKTIILKSHCENFEAISQGRRTADIRKNDRDFQAGDVLLLRQYDPARDIYTGHECRAEIREVLTDRRALNCHFEFDKDGEVRWKDSWEYVVLCLHVGNSQSGFRVELAGKTDEDMAKVSISV